MGNICEGPSWVITWGNIWVICGKYLGSMLEIFVGAQSSLWACMGILVSGLMRFGPANLYLNNSQPKKKKKYIDYYSVLVLICEYVVEPIHTCPSKRENYGRKR